MPADGSEIRFDDQGKLTLLVGTHSTGQGHLTAYSQIVHDVLGVPFEDITLLQGDTDLVASGGGHGGSRSLMIGGSAMLGAAEAVREKGRAAAAHVLDAGIEDIEFGEGLYAVRGTNTKITLRELELALREEADLPEGMEGTLGSSATFERTRHSLSQRVPYCGSGNRSADRQRGSGRLCGGR